MAKARIQDAINAHSHKGRKGVSRVGPTDLMDLTYGDISREENRGVLKQLHTKTELLL